MRSWGPNGSGKSTLSKVISGHPAYEVTDGDILLRGESILDMEPDERARQGIFLAFQYPVEIPGVSIANFMRTRAQARSAAKKWMCSSSRRNWKIRWGCWRWIPCSPSALSTRASPAVKRSATRFCNWRCSSRSSR